MYSLPPNAIVCPYCNKLIPECDQFGNHLLSLHIERCLQRFRLRTQVIHNLSSTQPSAYGPSYIVPGQPYQYARDGLPVQAAGFAAQNARPAIAPAADQATSHGLIGAGTDLQSGEPPDVDLELRLGRPWVVSLAARIDVEDREMIIFFTLRWKLYFGDIYVCWSIKYVIARVLDYVIILWFHVCDLFLLPNVFFPEC